MLNYPSSIWVNQKLLVYLNILWTINCYDYECTTAHYLIFADRHWDNLRLEEGCHLWHFDLWADGFISFPVKPLLKDWKHVDFDSHVEALDAICSVDLSKISPNLSFWATIIQNHYYKLIFINFANTYMLCLFV